MRPTTRINTQGEGIESTPSEASAEGAGAGSPRRRGGAAGPLRRPGRDRARSGLQLVGRREGGGGGCPRCGWSSPCWPGEPRSWPCAWPVGATRSPSWSSTSSCGTQSSWLETGWPPNPPRGSSRISTRSTTRISTSWCATRWTSCRTYCATRSPTWRSSFRPGSTSRRLRALPGRRRSSRHHPDRIVIFRDTLRRDFGHDADLLRGQVTRTVRHELAHHVGFDELGVKGLDL